MKVLFQTIAVAFSMFSAIPTPQFEWNKKNMRLMLLAFPLVGLFIALLCYAVYFASLYWLTSMPTLLFGILMVAIPLLVTGGIHLDGYADTRDALASHKSMEEKLDIMKDPHIGSFATIRVTLYLLLLVGFWAALPDYDIAMLPLCVGFVLSRTLSGLAVTSFPMAKNTGLAHTFSDQADKKLVRICLLVLDVVISLLLLGYSVVCHSLEGFTCVLAAHLVFAYYHYMSKKYFGGITGDLAGWFLQEAELFMVIGVFLVQAI